MSIITAEVSKWRQYVLNNLGGATGIGTWRYRTETTTPPASGQIRFDNAVIASATEFYLHETNQASVDVSVLLDLLDIGSLMYIQQKDASDNFVIVEVGSIVDNGVYRTIGIANQVGQGSAPSQNEEVAIIIGSASSSSGSGDPSLSQLNVQDGNYTLVLSDKGKTIAKRAGGAGETYTIPANGAVAYPVGTWIAFDNDGGGDLSIAITTDTLEGTDGATGTRTLGDDERALIQKIDTTKWRYQATDL